MSSTRLLVLGVVRLFEPVHGYDVRRELVSWHAHEWGNVAPGSIYNALKSLTREGFLEVSGTDQVGARPERTSYRLTATGNQEFLKLVRECWSQVQIPVDPLMAAVAFLPVLPRAEVVGYLRQRARTIEELLAHSRLAQQHLVRASHEPDPRRGKVLRHEDGSVHLDDYKPEHVFETFELLHARVASELGWLRALAERLEAGAYHLSGEPGPTWGEPSGARPAAGGQAGARRRQGEGRRARPRDKAPSGRAPRGAGRARGAGSRRARR